MNTYLLLLAIGWSLIGGFLRAGEQVDGISSKDNANGPYCGIYSLHRAMSALGVHVDFERLVNPQYVGSKRGSSADELQRAASDFGLSTECLSRMNIPLLGQINYPVILHVKRSFAARTYDHWVLFGGFCGDQVRIYDGILPETLIEQDELNSRWDGFGIIVSGSPIKRTWVYGLVLSQFAIYAGFILVLLSVCFLLDHVLLRRNQARAFARSLVEAVAICIVAWLGLIAAEFLLEGGYFSCQPAIVAIQDNHYTQFVPKINADQVQRIIDSKSALVVDARLEEDFAHGHIEGSINIPPDLSSDHIHEALGEISPSRQIVIYCQSNVCPFAETVAKRLETMGFHGIVLFSDGWVGWVRHERAKK